MKKKAKLLTAVSVLTIVGGIVCSAYAVFVHYLLSMDRRWFTDRFGPSGGEQYRTYDVLYEQTLVIIGAANKYTIGFYVGGAVAFLFLGAVCALWARDANK